AAALLADEPARRLSGSLRRDAAGPDGLAGSAQEEAGRSLRLLDTSAKPAASLHLSGGPRARSEPASFESRAAQAALDRWALADRRARHGDRSCRRPSERLPRQWLSPRTAHP